MSDAVLFFLVMVPCVALFAFIAWHAAGLVVDLFMGDQ